MFESNVFVPQIITNEQRTHHIPLNSLGLKHAVRLIQFAQNRRITWNAATELIHIDPNRVSVSFIVLTCHKGKKTLKNYAIYFAEFFFHNVDINSSCIDYMHSAKHLLGPRPLIYYQ